MGRLEVVARVRASRHVELFLADVGVGKQGATPVGEVGVINYVANIIWVGDEVFSSYAVNDHFPSVIWALEYRDL